MIMIVIVTLKANVVIIQDVPIKKSPRKTCELRNCSCFLQINLQLYRGGGFRLYMQQVPLQYLV